MEGSGDLRGEEEGEEQKTGQGTGEKGVGEEGEEERTGKEDKALRSLDHDSEGFPVSPTGDLYRNTEKSESSKLLTPVLGLRPSPSFSSTPGVQDRTPRRVYLPFGSGVGPRRGTGLGTHERPVGVRLVPPPRNPSTGSRRTSQTRWTALNPGPKEFRRGRGVHQCPTEEPVLGHNLSRIRVSTCR